MIFLWASLAYIAMMCITMASFMAYGLIKRDENFDTSFAFVGSVYWPLALVYLFSMWVMDRLGDLYTYLYNKKEN
jgi:hypothetical protein